MRRILAAALLVLAGTLAPARADDDEDVVIPRHLNYLYLGDTLEDVQKIFVPAQEWPSYREPRHRVNRIRIERSFLKKPERDVDVMWLGMRRNRLVELQLIYDARATRRRSVDAVVREMSQRFGDPACEDGRCWWSDGKTVMRVFYAEVPANNEDGTRGVELRTSIQLAEAWLFEKRS